jgi:hypothetical protein
MGKGSCGRVACTLNPAELKKQVGVDSWKKEEKYKPCYNVV